MEAFDALTRNGHFSEAAHLLDLSDLPQADQADEGRLRAELLAILLERKVVIPWSSLADRPDAWLSGSADNNQTGRVRRSILIDTLEMGSHRVPLRLNRIKPGEDADPVWVFSRQTVANIPELHRLYGPTELEQSLPNWARHRSLFGMYVWELLFMPLLVGIALLVSTFAYRTLRRIGDNANRRWLRFAARSFKWPIAITLCALIIGIATRKVLVVTGLLDAIIDPFVTIAYVFSATLALVLIADEVMDRISKNNPNELADPDNAHMRSMATTLSAARKFVIVIAVLAGTGIVLSSISTFDNLGFSLSGLCRCANHHPWFCRTRGSGQHPRLRADRAQPLGPDRRSADL